MRGLLFIALLFLICMTSAAQVQFPVSDTETFYLYGGPDFDEARSIKELPGGGYILAGTSSSFGQGNTSIYLVKTDSLGNHLWSAPYGGSQNDWGYSVEVTADSGYFVSGYSNSFDAPNGYDGYYFKTDKNGNTQWQKTVGGADWDYIYGSTPMPGGGYLLCGESYSNSNGGTDAWLVRINNSGDTLWTKKYGGAFNEAFNQVLVLNNRLYAVGKNATHSSDTISDGWIVKMDTSGNVLGQYFISGPHHFEEVLYGVAAGDSPYFYFCGYANRLDTAGKISSIIGKIDTAFNFYYLYYDTLHAADGISYKHIIPIDTGICLVGYANGGFGGTNMFFVGYDKTGGFINDYAHHAGGEFNDYGYDGIYTRSKRIIGVGSSMGSNTHFCQSAGAEDAFLARYNGQLILNNNYSTPNYPRSNCFKDTLFFWQASMQAYSSDIVVKLFPNPATDQLIIEVKGNDLEYTASFYDLLGNEVERMRIMDGPSLLNVQHFAPGNYFVKISGKSGQLLSVLKFVKSE